ncbi:MAG: hypothetical protein IJF15_03165 [Oscillospiraceae bacterium]|nr:hypothetical protein [Oscillospiraceae bacterium]
MRKMLLAIFLMLISIWCFCFGVADNFAALLYASIILLFISILVFAIGYSSDEKKK